MFVDTSTGRISILDIDESSRQIADHDGDNYCEGDEVVLAQWEDFGPHWTATKYIKNESNEQ